MVALRYPHIQVDNARRLICYLVRFGSPLWHGFTFAHQSPLMVSLAEHARCLLTLCAVPCRPANSEYRNLCLAELVTTMPGASRAIWTCGSVPSRSHR